MLTKENILISCYLINNFMWKLGPGEQIKKKLDVCSIFSSSILTSNYILHVYEVLSGIISNKDIE